MSENEHVTAINRAVAELWDKMPEVVVAFGGVELIDRINDHADALAAQLREAEERNKRWKRYFTALDRNGQLEDRCEPWDSEESLAVHRELKAAGEELVKHGDLPDADTASVSST